MPVHIPLQTLNSGWGNMLVNEIFILIADRPTVLEISLSAVACGAAGASIGALFAIAAAICRLKFWGRPFGRSHVYWCAALFGVSGALMSAAYSDRANTRAFKHAAVMIVAAAEQGEHPKLNDGVWRLKSGLRVSAETANKVEKKLAESGLSLFKTTEQGE